nr:MAG TPA: hypothetical protein [Caudoviricetes sp.]
MSSLMLIIYIFVLLFKRRCYLLIYMILLTKY